MLRALRQHPLLVGVAEVLTDAIRYVAIVLVTLVVLAQLAKMILRWGWPYCIGSEELAAFARGSVIRQTRPSLRQSSATLPLCWYARAWLSIVVPKPAAVGGSTAGPPSSCHVR
jgi:hypothetical protein